MVSKDSKTYQLERALAKRFHKRYAVGTNSCTDAIFLSLKALGIGPGDEVITSVFGFIVPAEAIANTGATPVFVDMGYRDFLIDVLLIEKAITEKTKAIIPAHLFGQCCDLKGINRIAKEYGLAVIEDAAQAFGNPDIGKGDVLCLSFHPKKSLGGTGDGGMMLTSNKKLYNKFKLLHHHGGKYDNKVLGWNSRLDDVQAEVLLDKLKTFDKKPIKHLYTFRTPNRNLLFKWLQKQGIDVKIFYKTPLHLQPALKYLGYKKGDFPVAEQACKEVLTTNVYEKIPQIK